MIRSLLLAFQFLTIVPIRVAGDISERDVARSVPYFPFIGVFQGLVTATAALLAATILPVDVAAGFAVLCLILSNYGFDLDGLADTFDGLAVKSSGDYEKDRMKRLTVMKDSATGAMGVIAIVMVILLKFLLIKTLLLYPSRETAWMLLVLMTVLSKWLMVPAMYHGRSAREDGLGRIFIDHTSLRDVVISTVFLLILFLPLVSLHFDGITGGSGIIFLAALLLTAYFLNLLAVKFLTAKFGGLTGDHFGALAETGEVCFLAAVCVWLTLGP